MTPLHRLDRTFGFTLIELMIAMVLGLLLVASVGALSVSASRSYRLLNQAGELLENGRYALEILRRDLEQAGFYGIFEPAFGHSTHIADPCETSNVAMLNATNPADLFSYAVLDADALTDLDCTQSERKSGTAALITRHAHTCGVATRCPTSAAEIESDKLYLYSKPDRAQFTPFASTFESGDLTDIREYHVSLYYIRDDTIPTLMLKTPTATDNNPNAQSLVDGIENLQFQYGIDSDNNGTTDLYKPTLNDSTLPTLEEWPRVLTVRAFVLARSLEIDPGFIDTETYDLGTTTIGPFNDHYHRRLFSQVIALPNLIQRRVQ